MKFVKTSVASWVISSSIACGARGVNALVKVGTTKSHEAPDVAFLSAGTTVHQLEYANIEFKVDLGETEDAYAHLKKILWVGYQNAKKGTFDAHARKNRWHQAERSRLRTHAIVENMKSTESYRHPNHRGKRFIGAAVAVVILLLGSLAAASIYGIFSGSEIKSMKYLQNTISTTTIKSARGAASNTRSLQEMNIYINALDEAIKDKSDHVYAGGSYINNAEFTGAEEQVFAVGDARVAMLECAFSSAIQKHLCPLLLQEINVDHAAAAVDKQASARGLVPVAGFKTDWLQHEVSFVKNDGQRSFTIFLHIPLVAPDSMMNVFKHVHMPLPLGAGFQLTISSPLTHIAINTKGTLFKAMTQADLQDCRQYGTFYACPRGNAVNKAPAAHKHDDLEQFSNDPATCLWALHEQKYQIARRTCDHHVGQHRDSVEQLSANDFAVFANKPHQGKITCRDSTLAHSKTVSLEDLTVVSLPAGCTCTTDTHVFSSSDAAFTRDARKWGVQFKWPKTLREQLAQGLDIPAYAPIFRNITRRSHATTVHLHDAIHQLEMAQAKSAADAGIAGTGLGLHWFTASPGTLMGLIAIIISAIALHRSGRPRTPAPAQAGPGTVLTLNTMASAPPAYNPLNGEVPKPDYYPALAL
jgi:hypothetical protein